MNNKKPYTTPTLTITPITTDDSFLTASGSIQLHDDPPVSNSSSNWEDAAKSYQQGWVEDE